MTDKLNYIVFGPNCSDEELDKKLEKDLVDLNNRRVECERLKAKVIALLGDNYINLSDYLLNLLTVLGQMDHIGGNNACKHKHVDSKEHTVSYHENGKMSMLVKDRAKLIDDGWKILRMYSK